jgi:hypothetical protein
MPGSVVRLELALSAGPLPDGDGDGVPDVIDDCPAVADPAQDQPCAPPDGGTACPTPHIFCDNFDGEQPPGTWTGIYDASKGTGVLTIDNTLARSGDALNCHIPGNGGTVMGLALIKDFAPIFAGTISLRAYYNVTTVAHSSVVAFLDDSNGDGYALLSEPNGPEQPEYWTIDHDYPGSFGDYISPQAIVPGTWTCVEMEVGLGAQGHITLYVEDVNVYTTSFDTRVAAGIQELSLGLKRTPGTLDETVHVDDMVLADHHIGCH